MNTPLNFRPVPPSTLKATDADLAALEALVGKLGWEEVMYRLGVIISRQADETTGPHKGALEAAASLVNLWGPSFHFCDEKVCRAMMETQRKYRLATPEEIEQINKDADEAERLYFEADAADEPLIVPAPARTEPAESQQRQECQGFPESQDL